MVRNELTLERYRGIDGRYMISQLKPDKFNVGMASLHMRQKANHR